MKIKAILIILLLSAVTAGSNAFQQKQPVSREEIIYHIFQRSFYDSNGDLHGDLNGIRQKLDYLQKLGVTAVLLTPLYESVFYHNYFSSDFKKIDPGYGTLNDYLALVKELHRRGMKFYMDMETQYVTEDHIWWKDGINNPASKYSDYIIYDDKGHAKPTSIVFGVNGLLGYDSVYRKITTVNLNSPKVLDYNYGLFKYWMDPNGDGRFDDGVDGFRLDHMMDDLDGKHILPHLFDTFWNPLISKLRVVNPKIKIIAEQAQWLSLGLDYLDHGGVDRVFAFRLAYSVRAFSKKMLTENADSTFLATPAGKQQIVFLENHDTPRFSFGVKGDVDKLKVGAALNLLMGGVPSIYYGQELGMTGNSATFGPTDANELPDREAFEWYKTDQGKGMAYWYKQKGPHKSTFNNDKPNDGVSLEEEQNDPNSLWNFYRRMIAIRKANPVISIGIYKTLPNDNNQVFSFMRYDGNKQFVVAVNLSDKPVTANIIRGLGNKLKVVYGNIVPVNNGSSMTVSLPAFGIAVWN